MKQPDYLFYHPQIFKGVNTLLDEEAKHCVRVLRKRPGDEILITDGAGSLYTARLITADAASCRFEIVEQKYHAPPLPHITVAASPLKHPDRFEWMIEKCTEAGAAAFIPLICRRTQKKQVNCGRLKKISVSAIKQSLRPWLPEVHAPIYFNKLMQQHQHGIRLICSASGLAPSQWITRIAHSTEVLLLIGPEGDFTDEERQLAQDAGFLPVNLGRNRLRTETAAVAATLLVAAFITHKNR